MDFPNIKTKYKCPLCGGDVYERDNFYGCANYRIKDGNCQYKIWKKLFDIELPQKALDELLSGDVTSTEIDGFINKSTGMKQSHRLYYNKRQNMVKFFYDTSKVSEAR